MMYEAFLREDLGADVYYVDDFNCFQFSRLDASLPNKDDHISVLTVFLFMQENDQSESKRGSI